METHFPDITAADLDKRTWPKISVGLNIYESAAGGAAVKYFSGKFERPTNTDTDDVKRRAGKKNPAL